MAYLHIPNLYKDVTILLFKECYALEKIHGTSAHVAIKGGAVRLFSGGAKHEEFVALFNTDALLAAGLDDVIVFGEACGGKMQKMSHTYGPTLRFVAFEVKIGDAWLSVPNSADVSAKLGLEFVPFERVPATVEALNAERDRPSEMARRLGLGEQMREGIVVRPLVEFKISNGERVIVKHKRDEFRETATPREVDPGRLAVLEDADRIAAEWVTETRLNHVLDALTAAGETCAEMEDTGRVIRAMTEDVFREGSGEVVDSKDARKAVGAMVARLWKRRISKI